MHYPKQIINSINYFSYFKSFIFENKSLEKKLVKRIKALFNINKEVKLLGRARSGIYLSVKVCLKRKKNNLILMSPYTIPEVIDLVLAAGGKPVFLDHRTNSTDILMSKFKKYAKLNPNAVIITHYHTNQKDYKEISYLCRKYNIALIEDCAISHSGKSCGINIGESSDFSIYSFSSYKFINYFFGGAISYKKNYSDYIHRETSNWKKLKPSHYLKKCFQTLKFEIYTNKYFFEIFTFNILKILKNNKNLFLNKKKYLEEAFKLDKTYFSLPSHAAIEEIYNKTFNYKKNLMHRQRISKVYYKFLKNISVIENKNSVEFFKNNEFMHFLITAKNLNHKEYLLENLLSSGFYVGGFFYPNCSNIKKYRKYGKTSNLTGFSNTLITLPTHNRIKPEYAKNLSRKILEIY